MESLVKFVDYVNSLDQNSAGFAVLVIIFLSVLTVVLVVIGVAIDVYTKRENLRIRKEEKAN